MPNRRDFLMGCSAAIAAMSGAQLSNLALAAPGNTAAGHTLVVLSLRGGWDALSVLVPLDGPDRGLYEAARPNLRLPRTGAEAALPISAQFGLHPALAPLRDLYAGKQLAVVCATGIPNDTRSHFDAMEYMELGTAGGQAPAAGWLTRHLASAPGPQQAVNVLSPALSIGNSPTPSLRGRLDALALGSPDDFKLDDNADERKRLMDAISALYQGDSWLHRAGQETLKSLNVIAGAGFGKYAAAGGAQYPDTELGHSFETVARMLKQGLGLRVATVDYGGWDTHEWQGDDGKGHLADQLGELAKSLSAFWTDLSASGGMDKRVTVVAMSEFGRRVAQNASGGTDHGHGGAMLLLGGGVRGGQVYGQWPGLSEDALYDRSDLAVTTDYRQVLGEVIRGPLGNPNLDQVFPGFKVGKALGVV